MDELALKRLRWRCRRGLLENDIVLERFLEVHGRNLSAGQLEAFNRLLDLEDKQIWDLVSRRREPGDPELAGVVELLRSCWRGERERRN
jgi:antitoxin CptB